MAKQANRAAQEKPKQPQKVNQPAAKIQPTQQQGKGKQGKQSQVVMETGSDSDAEGGGADPEVYDSADDFDYDGAAPWQGVGDDDVVQILDDDDDEGDEDAAFDSDVEFEGDSEHQDEDGSGEDGEDSGDEGAAAAPSQRKKKGQEELSPEDLKLKAAKSSWSSLKAFHADETNFQSFAGTSTAAWSQLGVHPWLLRGLQRLGFAKPTAIQQEVLPAALGQQKDIVGAAQTVG